MKGSMFIKLIKMAILGFSAYGILLFGKSTQNEVEGRHDFYFDLPLASLDPQMIDLMLLGHYEIYENFVHISTNQYLGTNRILERPPEKLHEALKKLFHLKIKSASLYKLGCVRLIFSFNRPDLCVDVAQAGIEALPSDWLIPSILGLAYLRMGETENAAQIYDYAGTIDGSPSYFKSVGQKIRKNSSDDGTLKRFEMDLLKEFEADESNSRMLQRLR